jgi:hypothetical protein
MTKDVELIGTGYRPSPPSPLSAITRYVPRLLPRLPGSIAGLIGGTALFQIICYHPNFPAVPAEHWVIGACPPGPDQFRFAIPIRSAPGRRCLGRWFCNAAFALAVLSSLNTCTNLGAGRHRHRPAPPYPP